MTGETVLRRREKQYVDALARGLSNEEIAGELRIAPQTVKNQLSVLYEKVGVGGRRQLLALAKERGWL